MKIAVIGSGIAGCASALFLHELGFEVEVLEAVSDPRPLGAGFLLQPTGQAVLRRLGLFAQVDALAQRVDRLYGDTASGKAIVQMQYADLHPQAFGMGVQRGAMMGVLWQALKDKGLAWRCGCSVTGWDESAAGVRLFQEGVSLGVFDGVVLANGTFSALRKRLPIRQFSKVFPWGAWWAMLPLDAQQSALLDKRLLRQRFRGAREMLGFMPAGKAFPDTVLSNASTSFVSAANAGQANAPEGLNFFWSVPTVELGTGATPDLEAIKAKAVALYPEAEDYLQGLTDVSQLKAARYADVWMQRWHHGRFLVVGDCAHAMSPQLGQGANMALLDAWGLFQALAQQAASKSGNKPHWTPELWQSALAQYSRKRKAHLRFYQQASFALTPLFQSSGRILPAMRDAVMPISNRIPWVARENIRTLAGMKAGWFLGRLDMEGLTL